MQHPAANHPYHLLVLPKRSKPFIAMHLTYEEYDDVKTRADRTIDLQSFIDFYNIVEQNFVEASRAAPSAIDDVSTGAHANFAEINRAFINMLNSFCAWLEHCEKRAKHRNSGSSFSQPKIAL